MVTRTQDHNETGRAFLARARDYLAEDDLLQASEKGWGAAARMVKAVAEQHGWSHNGHRDLYSAINRLAAETDDPHLRTLFDSASALHANFYEGWMPGEMVAASLDQVSELVEKLDALTGSASD